MKKSFLAGVSIFALGFAGSAFANDSDIEQIGDNNLATVTQTGGSGGTSDIDQTGDDDIATVTQSDGGAAGTNSSTIEQIGGSGTQTATVTQTNAGNGPANVSTVTQNATQGGNTVAVAQDGSGNNADADQGPAASDPLVFFGIPFPTTPNDVLDNQITINQTGDGNTATGQQILASNGGERNSISIDQFQSGNTATVIQGTGSGAFDPSANDNDNMATIMQDGATNTSSITQGGELGLATNTQIGDNNASTILQSGGIPAGLPLGPNGNTALVTQMGDGNTSTVDQTDSFVGDLIIIPAGNLATVNQFGDTGTSTVNQDALGGHTATVTQLLGSTGAESTIDQSGLFNTAEVTQGGDDQESLIDQTGMGSFLALANTVTVTQTATDGNHSSVNQTGTMNSTTIAQ